MKMNHCMGIPIKFLLAMTFVAIFCVFSPLIAQDDSTEEPVRGGVTYEPIRTDEERLRDPFKSPFEIEQEKKDREKNRTLLSEDDDRVPYNISELSLRGIYLTAKSGYWAIFEVGEVYKWYPVGIKFLDGDLVNITDGAVVFKHYISEDTTKVREVVKELRRGEE